MNGEARAADEGVWSCGRCGAAFRDAALRDLHEGRRHAADLGREGRERFERAEAAEAAALARLRHHIRAGFAVLPVFLLFVFVGILLVELDGNPAWLVMVTPGFAAFGALLYAMSYSRHAGRNAPGPPRPGAP